MSNVRSGGKVFDRCMANCFQCTDDMPTERDFPPVYGPSCGISGRLAVERQDSLKLVEAKPIETD